jgi:SAM-dependent methyltransferase
MASINRVEPFTALSDAYQAAGFATYSLAVAPNLLQLAFDLDWSGRSLLDLGCGTGDAACWFSEHGFRTLGVDNAAPMLRFGMEHAKEVGLNVNFVCADMRTFKPELKVEMVTSLGGSLNYIPTLRDLESVFRQVHESLIPGKLFFFDLRTIKGLAQDGNADQVVFDNGEDTLIVARHSFNYETLLRTTQYTVLRYPDDMGWQRAEETHNLRGFPVQAVISLLGKTGFKLLQTLTTDFEPAEGRDAEQLIFVTSQDGG